MVSLDSIDYNNNQDVRRFIKNFKMKTTIINYYKQFFSKSYQPTIIISKKQSDMECHQ